MTFFNTPLYACALPQSAAHSLSQLRTPSVSCADSSLEEGALGAPRRGKPPQKASLREGGGAAVQPRRELMEIFLHQCFFNNSNFSRLCLTSNFDLSTCSANVAKSPSILFLSSPVIIFKTPYFAFIPSAAEFRFNYIFNYAFCQACCPKS